MSFFEWKESMSVNVEEIDKQHQKLVQIIGDLYKAMSTGKGKDILGDVLKQLIDYTKYHFSFEEKYFDQFEYPDTIVHKKGHSDFVKKVSDFKKKFDSGNTMLSIDVLNFLKDWLVKHIQGTDKKYAPFFNEKGLK